MEKFKILEDDREFGALNDYFEVLEVERDVQRLTIGDYVWISKNREWSGAPCKLCFERKTIDDFCASIMDGRLDEQIRNMKSFFNTRDIYILISGRIDDRKSDMNENCILGKIVSLIIKAEVKVILVDDDRQLAYVIKNIIEKKNEELKESEMQLREIDDIENQNRRVVTMRDVIDELRTEGRTTDEFVNEVVGIANTDTIAGDTVTIQTNEDERRAE
jgi:ERCC4-type nuclease